MAFDATPTGHGSGFVNAGLGFFRGESRQHFIARRLRRRCVVAMQYRARYLERHPV
jgi:hypothetical protein